MVGRCYEPRVPVIPPYPKSRRQLIRNTVSDSSAELRQIPRRHLQSLRNLEPLHLQREEINDEPFKVWSARIF